MLNKTESRTSVVKATTTCPRILDEHQRLEAPSFRRWALFVLLLQPMMRSGVALQKNVLAWKLVSQAYRSREGRNSHFLSFFHFECDSLVSM